MIEMGAHEASSVLTRRLYRSRQIIEIMDSGGRAWSFEGVRASA
jgi:hypothetical protein